MLQKIKLLIDAIALKMQLVFDALPTKTSELANDGKTGSAFVEEIDLETIAFTGNYNDLKNIPAGQGGVATEETGTAIGLGNVLGSTDPSPTPYTDSVFTIKPDPVLLGWGTRLWSSAGKTEFATVTGATYVDTSPFFADSLYYLRAYNAGHRNEYWFEITTDL